jgi:hypothetical protein
MKELAMRSLPIHAGRVSRCSPVDLSYAVRRRGSTLLELQVAFIVFGIALTGIGPLVVMHSRQLKKLESRFQPQTTYYVVPAANVWARKLGSAATISTSDSAPVPSGQALVTANDVQVQSLERSLEHETLTVVVQVNPN